MATVNLGSVHGKLELDISEWEKNTEKAKSSLAGIGTVAGEMTQTTSQRFSQLGQDMQKVGTLLTAAVTVPITLFQKSAIGLANDTEVAWKEVQKVYGSTADAFARDVDMLQGKVRELSIKFGKNKLEVLDALAAISAMGYEGANAVDVLTQALEFSTTGQMSLNDAMAGAVAISKIYGVEGEDLRKMLAGLNTVENSTAATMADLNEAVQIAGQTANVAGIDINELSGFMAVLRERAIPAGEAANGLKSIFTRMLNPSKEAQAIYEKFGFTIKDSNGSFKEGNVILEELAQLWPKLTDVEREELAQSNAMLYQKNKFLTLMDELGKENNTYQQTLKAVSDEEQNVSTYTSEMNIFLDTNRTKMAQAKVAFDEAKVALGGIWADAIIPVLNGLAGLAKAFGEAPGWVHKVTAGFLSLLAILGPVTYFIGALLNPTSALHIGLTKFLIPAIKLLTSGLGKGLVLAIKAVGAGLSFLAAHPVVAILILLAALGILIWKNWDKISPVIQAVGKAIQEWIMDKVEKAKAIWDSFKQTLSGLWEGFLTKMTSVGTSISNFFTVTIPNAINSILEWFSSLPSKIGAFLATIPTILKNAFITGFDAIIYSLGFMLSVLLGLPAKVFQIFTMVLDKIIEWAGLVWAFISVEVPRWINSVVEWVSALPGRIWEWLVNVYNRFVEWGQNTWNFLVAEVNKWITNVVAWISTLPAKIWNWLVSVYNRFVQWGQDTWTFLSTEVPKWVKNVIDWIGSLPGKIWTALSDLSKQLVTRFTDAWNDLKAEISQWPSRIWEWGKNIAQSFLDGFKNALKHIGEVFKQGMEDGKKFMEGKSPPEAGPLKNIDKWGFNIGQAWTQGLQSALAGFELPTDFARTGVRPSPAVATTNNVTNSPVFNVNIGVYAGTEMEKRNVAKEMVDAFNQYLGLEGKKLAIETS